MSEVGWQLAGTAWPQWGDCFALSISFFCRLAWAWPYDNGRGASEQEETRRSLGARLRMAHHLFHLVILAKVSHELYGIYSALMSKTPILKGQGGVKMGDHQCNQSSTAGERRNPGEKNIPHLVPSAGDLVGRTFMSWWCQLCLAGVHSDWPVPTLFWYLNLLNIILVHILPTKSYKFLILKDFCYPYSFDHRFRALLYHGFLQQPLYISLPPFSFPPSHLVSIDLTLWGDLSL